MKTFLILFFFSTVYAQSLFFGGIRDAQNRFRDRIGNRRSRKNFQVTVPPLPQFDNDNHKWHTFPPETSVIKPVALTTSSNKDCVCGIENDAVLSSRIVGGYEVKPKNRYPWMALITDKGESLCGGAVINDRYIVTAAHCIDVCEEAIENCKVVLGVHNVTEGVNTYEIEKVTKHEEYRLFINDIGLIKLKKQIKFNEAVKPICLPEQQQSRNIKPYEQSIMTAGWGLTGSGKPSDVLMHFNATDWLKSYKSKSRFCKDLLCLTSGPGRFESGDSGGPAWITANKKAVIVGIVSHYRLHRMRLTRVPLVKEWIMKNTESAHYCE